MSFCYTIHYSVTAPINYLLPSKTCYSFYYSSLDGRFRLFYLSFNSFLDNHLDFRYITFWGKFPSKDLYWDCANYYNSLNYRTTTLMDEYPCYSLVFPLTTFTISPSTLISNLYILFILVILSIHIARICSMKVKM